MAGSPVQGLGAAVSNPRRPDILATQRHCPAATQTLSCLHCWATIPFQESCSPCLPCVGGSSYHMSVHQPAGKNSNKQPTMSSPVGQQGTAKKSDMVQQPHAHCTDGFISLLNFDRWLNPAPSPCKQAPTPTCPFPPMAVALPPSPAPHLPSSILIIPSLQHSPAPPPAAAARVALPPLP